MCISTAASRALAASVALTIFAGCSGGSLTAPAPLGQTTSAGIQSAQLQAAHDGPNNIGVLLRNRSIASARQVTTRRFMSRGAAGKPLVFVADGTSNVSIYLARGNNKMVGQISGLNFPWGLATDTARNLYIAEGSDVLVYAPPYTGMPTLVLDDTGYFPSGVAVSADGAVGVTNTCIAPSCSAGTGSVTLYAKNSTEPCATLIADATNFPYGPNFGAFDDKGTFYIDGQGPSYGSTFGEVKGGCSAKRIRLLTTTNNGGIPDGIQVDKADHVAALQNQSGQATIYTYDRPKNGSLGNPISSTPMTGSPGAYTFAFLRSGNALYTAVDGQGVAAQYDYPAGGAAEKSIPLTTKGPAGIAVTPPLVP